MLTLPMFQEEEEEEEEEEEDKVDVQDFIDSPNRLAHLDLDGLDRQGFDDFDFLNKCELETFLKNFRFVGNTLEKAIVRRRRLQRKQASWLC